MKNSPSLPLVLVAAAAFIGLEMPARAGSIYDVKITETIPAGVNFSATGSFTKDGAVIQGFSFQFLNGTNAPVTKTFSAVAPAGTNDREYAGTKTNIVAAATLPSGQVADYAAFLTAHGFEGGPTFDSPLVQVASGASAYQVITDINAFLPFANAANFAIGSLFTTDSNGVITALPGLTFYSDAAHTTVLANTDLVVTGFLSESAIPEPSSLVLSGIALGVLGLGWSRRHRAAAERVT